MEVKKVRDIEEVKREFAQWRESKGEGRKIIPKQLWEAAIGLLEKHTMSEVCRELGLSYKQVRKQLNGKATATFMELNAQQLGLRGKIEKKQSTSMALANQPLCEVVIERVDGNRLSLNLPLEWTAIERLCANFLGK